MSYRRHRRHHRRLGAYVRDREAPAAEPEARRLPFAFAELEAPDDPPPEFRPVPARVPRPGDPSAEELLHREGRMALQRGEARRAVDVYRQVLELNPQDGDARTALAQGLLDAGEPLAALEELERLGAVAPDAAPALRVARGTALGQLGRYEEALAVLRQVLDVEPGNVDGQTELGLVLARRGRWRDAAPHFRRAVELDQGRASTYLHLGEALNHTDDLHGSLQAFQRAAELRPNNPRALRGLGIVLDRLRRPAEAAEMYRRARELTGT